jgi:hypothetical protein
MKKVILLLSVCALFGLKSFGQFTFSVAPGLSTNAANFGFKVGKVVPYIGFQYARIGGTLDYKSHYYDGSDWVTDKYGYKLSANIYVPEVGVKFFAVEQNKIKAYFNLNVAKPFIRGKLEVDGTEIDEVGDVMKDIKLIAGEFGFGVEYFFDDNFSIGGEYGIRYYHGKYETSEIDTYNGEDREETDTYKVNVSPTYAKITLNFYFGGNKAE